MGYDHGDSFPFDFEPNGIPFGLKSKGKLSPRPYSIQFESKWKYSFLSVGELWKKICLHVNKKNGTINFRRFYDFFLNVIVLKM